MSEEAEKKRNTKVVKMKRNVIRQLRKEELDERAAKAERMEETGM